MSRQIDMTAVAAYCEEVRVSCPAILAAFAAVEREPEDHASAQEAFRLFHALKGAAAMVGLPALGYLLNQAEELVDTAITADGPFPEALRTSLCAAVPRFSEYLDTALVGGALDGIAQDLGRTFRALAGQPEDFDDPTLRELLEIEHKELAQHEHDPLPPSAPAAVEETPTLEVADADIDIMPAEPIPQELAEVFAQEAQEHLQTIARLTTRLTGGDEDRESLLELRRAVHTIKGAAGVVGYTAASRLAHRMEDLLDAFAEGTVTVTAESSRLLSSSSDALDDLISGNADPGVLRQTLGGLLREYDSIVMPPAPAVSAAPRPSSGRPEPLSKAEAPAKADAPLDAPPSTDEEWQGPDRRQTDRRQSDRRQGDRRKGGDRRAGSQVVRVPFERLNELVRLVSELVLNRSTFDQHYSALINEVDELRLSTARLRRVTQKLETDYEVRALGGNLALASGSRRSKAGGHGFDELEFDRYTDFHLLTRELVETASDIGTVTTRLGDTIGDFDSDLTRLGRLTREVQDKAMEFRMVPLVTLAARLERTVRVTAESCGKTADLVLEGENVALDKTLLEEMADAMVHLLRNAVDHGIEPPAIRLGVGKTERGRIIVRAFHEGTDVVIEVEDDGAGVDLEKIRRTAIEKEFVGPAEGAALTDEELRALIFEPGFSTTNRVSEVSGRGVGLDVVRAKVAKLNGRVRLTSSPQGGAMFTIRVPMTLAITRVLIVRAGGQTLGLPLGAIVQIVRGDAASISLVGTERVANVDGRTYPLRDLAETLGLPQSTDAHLQAQPILIANLSGRRTALAVDQIVQTRDAVVKTLGTHLRRIQGIWGATLLGDGTVVLILNPADLIGSADAPRARRGKSRVARPVEQEGYSVLVVDDSLSMRHVLSSVVRKAGWNALQARDGVEALEVIHQATRPPDLVLLDIEMPRMDGYEFLATIRGQAAHASLPIVMLTSRGGEKHREKAFALGASGYVVKPFQEDALLETMTNLMGAGRRVERKAAS